MSKLNQMQMYVHEMENYNTKMKFYLRKQENRSEEERKQQKINRAKKKRQN